jgi:DNA-directed RNA polymerase subunit N (RpoN/RPB10)
MALVSGKSRCALCGERVGAAPLVGFRHFVRNRKDPLFVLTDSAVHQRCFEESPLRERALKRLEERASRMHDRRCAVCGQQVEADWYTIDHLTDDPSNPLFEFNYVHFHRAHLALWPDLPRFRQLVEKFVRSGQYEGPSILPSDLA